MYDLSKEMKAFYENCVRLGASEQRMLATHRDASLARLRAGLAALREEDKLAGPYAKKLDQGSYAMDLIIQQPDDDYDIDIAVIFPENTISASALDARTRVLEALERGGGNFSKPPERRTNAVTVWYADGHHIDFAVYRSRQDWLGREVVEHASDDWRQRDPNAVTEWFAKELEEKEPYAIFTEKTVEKQQLRRIVRLVKAFARSRSSWSLPGGMILTTLVVETYKGDVHRDDVALAKTLRALNNRLRYSTSVANPVDGSELTGKLKFAKQVERLRDRLAEWVPKLHVLDSDNCTREQALSAWNAIFRHSHWGEALESERSDQRSVAVEVGISRNLDGRVYKSYDPSGHALQKGLWLRFRLSNVAKYDGCSVRWTVKNAGDEAEEAGQLEHETVRLPSDAHWECTAYKGTHLMICTVERNGDIVARTKVRVRIGSR